MRMNKKGIGFGRMLAILVFILLGLLIWILSVATQRVDSSVGTNETNQFDKRNAEFYFLDSMRLSFFESLNETATDSFINTFDQSCFLYSDGKTKVLTDNCKPDSAFINNRLASLASYRVSKYMGRFFNQTVEVNCQIDQDILSCESSEVYLNASRKNDFFKYNIFYKFKLKNSITMGGLNDLTGLYEQAKSCTNPSCDIISRTWDLKSVEQSGEFFVFSLETKKEYPHGSGIEKIRWKFATKNA